MKIKSTKEQLLRDVYVCISRETRKQYEQQHPWWNDLISPFVVQAGDLHTCTNTFIDHHCRING